MSGPASSTAIASTAPRTRATGTASTRTSWCSIRTRKRSPGPSRGTMRCSATRIGQPQADLSFDPRDSAPFAPLAAVVDPAFTWGDDRRRARRGTRRSSTRCTCAASRSCIRGFPSAFAAPTRRSRREPRDQPSDEAWRHGGRAACRCTTTPTIATWSRAGLTNYWGYNTLGVLRARTSATRPSRRPPARCASSSAWCGRCTPPASRSSSTSSTTTRPKAITSGPTLSLRGIDNASYYRLARGEPALLHGLHRLRQHAEHAEPAGAAADHGQPAVLGARDARRRLPLRSGERARARAVRSRSAGGVLRHHPSGSGAVAGEADRRAVGRRRRRLPGRATSRCCGPSGTASTATPCAASGAATAAPCPSWPRGWPAAATCTSRSGRRPYASINFITAHDGFTLHDLVSYNEKHNEANGEEQPRRREQQPELELRRRGADRRSGASTRCASGRSATCWPRCCSRRACR